MVADHTSAHSNRMMSPEPNTALWDVTGIERIALGYAVSYTPPFTVAHIALPMAIEVGTVCQLGPLQGSLRRVYRCIEAGEGWATFV